MLPPSVIDNGMLPPRSHAGGGLPLMADPPMVGQTENQVERSVYTDPSAAQSGMVPPTYDLDMLPPAYDSDMLPPTYD